MAERIQKSLVVDGQEILSQKEWNGELDEKQQRLSEWLKRKGYAAALLRRHENIGWASGGASEGRVRIPQETQVFSLLITAAGGRYYLAGKNEGPRLNDEEFGTTDFEPVLYDWYADALLSEAKRLAGGKIATDYPTGDLPVENFYELRELLLPQEIARYRWLGEEVAASTADVLATLEPGMSEYEMEALLSAALLSGGVLPSVLLMAADERVYTYKHAVARGAELKRYGMLNLCARKWGLVVSITRYIHFGKLPSELAERFAAAAEVNAALLDATREGATAAQIFAAAKAAYAKVGHAEEIEKHHQGGATGYNEREWVATPAGAQVVQSAQAFAWNPSIKGAKVEDTTLLLDGAIETLTETPELPTAEASLNGKVYVTAGVLVRE